MRICVPLNDGWIYPNPFVALQIGGLKEISRDIEIETGVEKFWDSEYGYFDIVHIYWPQCLVYENYDCKTLNDLSVRLLELKARGTKIISTCLNLVAHYSDNNKLNNSYEIVYSMSDMIIHLAEYSKKLLENKYSNVIHVILPHHVYDTKYKVIPSKEIAHKRLGLNADCINILSFGSYRSDEERDLICQVADAFKNEPVYFIVPSYRILPSKIGRTYIKTKISLLWVNLIHRNMHCEGKYIKDELATYYAATDISFIQRIHILNSGNVPMGFLMGHVVIGTNEACVGEILKNTGNPTFVVNDRDSVVSAIKEGIELYKEGKGDKNRDFSLREWSINRTSNLLYFYYRKILDR